MSWTCCNCFSSQAIPPPVCITREQILQKSFLSMLPTIYSPKLIRRYEATCQMEIVYMYTCELYIWENILFVICENCLLVTQPQVYIPWRSKCKHRKISQLKWEATRFRAAMNCEAGFRHGEESSYTHSKLDWVCPNSKRHRVNWKLIWKLSPGTTK